VDWVDGLDGAQTRGRALGDASGVPLDWADLLEVLQFHLCGLVVDVDHLPGDLVVLLAAKEGHDADHHDHDGQSDDQNIHSILLHEAFLLTIVLATSLRSVIFGSCWRFC